MNTSGYSLLEDLLCEALRISLVPEFIISRILRRLRDQTQRTVIVNRLGRQLQARMRPHAFTYAVSTWQDWAIRRVRMEPESRDQLLLALKPSPRDNCWTRELVQDAWKAGR